MPSDDDYTGPDIAVSVDVGAIGVALYIFMICLTVFGAYNAVNQYAKYMFYCATLYCIMELPLYLSLLILRKYTSQAAYAVHLIGQFLIYIESFK